MDIEGLPFDQLYVQDETNNPGGMNKQSVALSSLILVTTDNADRSQFVYNATTDSFDVKHGEDIIGTVSLTSSDESLVDVIDGAILDPMSGFTSDSDVKIKMTLTDTTDHVLDEEEIEVEFLEGT